jgi:hypothetical protein
MILDIETAILDAEKEKRSLVWRARLHLRNISDIARDLAIKTWDLVPRPLPEVRVSEEVDLDAADEEDTAKTPAPIPRKTSKPTKPGDQWEVITAVVDMRERRKGPGTRPGSLIPVVSDLTLDE